ncbi:glycosyltransferase family 4 protein [Prochlorococcus sp. AH-716-D22]|nr:glycosyltransferase family 4 protein [Prochlorococcus sp. AH-716-D22]
MSRKIDFIFLSNSSWYIWNFRRNLINELLKNKYSILVVAPKDSYSELIISKGCKFINWNLKRSSINPINEIISIVDLYKIYKKYKPRIVHHFTIKSCLYGSLIARIINKSFVVNSITGLGHLFLTRNFKNSLLKILLIPFYKFALNYKNSYLLFQNKSDLKIYKDLSLLKENRNKVIRGSGINSNYFSKDLEIKPKNKEPIILFPARIIKEKGIIELLKACSNLWNNNKKFKLKIVGSFDKGNRSFLTKETIYSLISHPNKIDFLGHVKNMRKIYSESDIVVLPSWREGISMSILEAGSMECPIITTNVPGCRDIVEHGISGLLVPEKDPKSLELALDLLIKNKNFGKYLGKNIRKRVIKYFDQKLIVRETMEIYQKSI